MRTCPIITRCIWRTLLYFSLRVAIRFAAPFRPDYVMQLAPCLMENFYTYLTKTKCQNDSKFITTLLYHDDFILLTLLGLESPYEQ